MRKFWMKITRLDWILRKKVQRYVGIDFGFCLWKLPVLLLFFLISLLFICSLALFTILLLAVLI